MFSRDKQLDLVIRVYVVGIAVTIAIALFVVLAPNIAPSWLILVAGVMHLLILTYFAWGVGDRPYVLTQAGNRVQTAGYLHTLIGFSSAVFMLNQESPDITALSIPLSSALVTSLVGWWAGGEISARGEAENPSLERTMQQIVARLKSHSDNLLEVQKDHLNRLEQDSNRLLTLQQTHAKKLEEEHRKHAERLLAFYQGYNNELVNLHQDITKNSSAISSEFSAFSTSINQDKDRIKTSLAGFESIINQQAQSFRGSIQSYDSASTEIANYATALSTNLKSLNQSSLSASQDVAKTMQSMQAASVQVQGWSKETSNSISQVNQLISDLQQLATYIAAQRGGRP
ncbi:MAG: Sec8 exocyst complex component specific domain [Phormidesmis priestleyi Ana]|uniref:Sec8 exocyst complex component specific domain n=1 Tax=Phormidesmis priestleyi Ana TaxID=1666911 RepID=A0A0P7ZPU0_9CYAN|nr:MAG: Sec8 exocyst complex component specific domain [Phormidesmis priestleyi Ana]